MARGTRTLAGQAVSAARRALGLQAQEDTEVVPPVTGTKAPAKKAAPARKAAPAKKAAAAKKAAPAKKAAGEKTVAKKTAATKTAAKKTTVKKTTAKKTAAKKTTATSAKQARTTHPTAPDEKAAPVTTSPAKKTTTKKPAAKKPAAKKATAKASAPKGAQDAADSLVVKSDEEAWTSAELDELLGELHEQRDHSAGVVEEMEAELEGLMRDSGDGAGQDQADVGATSFERDHEMSVLNSERDKLAQIDRALARIADGSYGQCESCGQPIGKLRLLAFPRATLCMPCKQREERR